MAGMEKKIYDGLIIINLKNLYFLDNFWQFMASVLCSDSGFRFKGRKIVYTQGTRCLIVLTDFAMQQSEGLYGLAQ